MSDKTARFKDISEQELEQIVGGTGVATGITVPSRTLQRATQLGAADSVRNMTYKGDTSGLPLDIPDPPSGY